MKNKIIKTSFIALLVVFILVAAIIFVFTPKVFIPTEIIENHTEFVQPGLLFEQKVSRYPIKANVSEIKYDNETKLFVGIAGQTNEVNYGLAPINSSIRKIVKFKNNEAFPIRVSIYVYGAVAPYVTMDENNVIINPGEFKEITTRFDARDLGYYTGEMTIISKMPHLPFLTMFI